MQHRKLNSVLFAATTIILSFACISCEKETPPIKLVMAELNPADSFVGNVDAVFKEKVESLSKGMITIDVQYGGVLGNEKQIMELAMTPDSVIQIVRASANMDTYTNGIPLSCRLLAIPYTFRDDEHFWNFVRSDLAEAMLTEPYEKGAGIRGLFFGQEGFRHFFSPIKIEIPQDLANKKMRMTGSVLKNLARSFNATVVDIPFPELFSSLSTGAAEVADQPLTNYYINAFYKVAPYMVLDGHTIGAFCVVINAACWDSLTEEQQQILKEASAYATDYCQRMLAESTADVTRKLQEAGAVLTPVSDIREWQKACVDMREEAASIDRELYQKILDF